MKIVVSITLLFTCFSFSFGQQEKSPKLVVGIVVDQMCYEYLYRYYDRFEEGGFKLLMNAGANCRNTNFNYIPTYTGPGHASIYTGTTPSNHGIVGNDWYDRTTGAGVNCVDDSLVQSVGTDSDDGEFSPRNLKSNTITDQLKLTYPKAKVIAMSIKNRGAILPGGHLSDGSYWYDYATGKFITSSFYGDQLPAWVEKFNGKNEVENYLKQDWTTYYPIESYVASGPDDSPYEHLLGGKSTPTFPYKLSEMLNGGNGYSLFTYTPFANTYLTDFAIASIESEQLGKDNQTDMLCISYSTPDMIGHAFGPQSVEIEDTYIRLDRDLKKLIAALEQKVGKGEFTLFITADHAVVPVPQLLIDKKLPGGYFFMEENMVQLREKTRNEYDADLILTEENLNIYLNHERIDSLGLTVDEVAKFVANDVQQWENVKRVFTAEELYHSFVDDEWTDMVRKGYHHAESGDVVFITEPGYLAMSSDSESARKGTSHGSAFSYDTHVPLIWYGKNIKAQEIYRNVMITDIAATLSHFLYVQNPSVMTGKPIVEVLGH